MNTNINNTQSNQESPKQNVWTVILKVIAAAVAALLGVAAAVAALLGALGIQSCIL